MNHNRLNLNDNDDDGKPRKRIDQKADQKDDLIQIPYQTGFEETGSINDPKFRNRPTTFTIKAHLDHNGRTHFRIEMPSATILQQLKLSTVIINRLVVQWNERAAKSHTKPNSTGDSLKNSMASLELISKDILKFLGPVTGNTTDNGDIHNK